MENIETLNEELEITEADSADTISSDESELPPEPTVAAIDESEAPQNVSDEAEALRQELSELKAYVESKEAKEARALSELEEFRRLYPDTELEALGSEVWQKVDEGLPLSAAYALAEREKELMKELAEQINLRNTATSAGSAGISPAQDYFSPDEVKAMSGEEVRKNYTSIRRSMDYWRKASK